MGGQFNLHSTKNKILRSKMSRYMADIESIDKAFRDKEIPWNGNVQFLVYLPKLSWRDSDG
jgi:hypothetical protein